MHGPRTGYFTALPGILFYGTNLLKFRLMMIIIYEPMKDQFKELEASEIFCSRCGKAQPVRKRLLLTLPGGDKYDYICAVCGEHVGGKMDEKDDNFRLLIR